MPEHAHLLISETGTLAGENKWVSCFWQEPTLPQKAREGWGNLHLLIGETRTVAREYKRVSCFWPEPTLPQKAREEWGNLVRSLDSERMGQPLLFSPARGPWRFDLDGSLPARRVVNKTTPFPVLWPLH